MAAKYRKVDPRIWNDEKFQRLTITEKAVAFYALTNQHVNRIGIFPFSPAAAAESIGLKSAEFERVWVRVCDTLRWRFDRVSKTLYLPTWWKYNAPESHLTMKGCLKDLHDVPQSVLVQEFASNTTYLSDTLAGELTRVCQGYAKGMPYQEQEQKQEQEQEQEQDLLRPVGRKKFVPPSVEEVRAYCLERSNDIDPERFIAYYASKGWKVGRDPMVDWKSAVVTFEKNNLLFSGGKKRIGSGQSHDPAASTKDPNHGRM